MKTFYRNKITINYFIQNQQTSVSPQSLSKRSWELIVCKAWHWLQHSTRPILWHVDDGRTIDETGHCAVVESFLPLYLGDCDSFVACAETPKKDEAQLWIFFLLIALWSRHVKPSSAKGEKRLKRKKITKFVQAEALPELEIMYKSKDRCTGMKDRITRDREIQRHAKTYQKPSPQTLVHLEQ